MKGSLAKIGAIFLTVFLGVIHLHFPLYGDQALFLVGAKSILDGGVLYADFWDLKQPGIFSFYYLAGALFGFTDFGVHLFELLYWGCFTWYGIWILRRLKIFEITVLNWFFPLFTIGVYYATASIFDLTQVEILVGFPLFVALTLPLIYLKEQRHPFLLFGTTGLCFGLVIFLKIIFLAILSVYVLFYTWFLIKKQRIKFSKFLLKTCLPVLGGTLLIPVITWSYFSAHGALGIMLETNFYTPHRIIAEIESKNPIAFLRQCWRFILLFAPLVAFAIIGILFKGKKKPELVGSMLIWLILGLFVIYLQKFSYWFYHYYLLLFPMGVLSLLGLEFVLQQNRWKTNLIVLITGLLFLPLVGKGLDKIQVFFKNKAVLTKENKEQYKQHYDPGYIQTRKEIATILGPESIPGDIYVCASPIYYYYSNRNQSVAITGWSLELMPHDIWNQLVQQLREHPTAYILIAHSYLELLNQHPQFTHFLNQHFQLHKESFGGHWYIRKTG